MSLEDEVPNHSTFSKNRHGRFRDSDLFRWLFNEVLLIDTEHGVIVDVEPTPAHRTAEVESTKTMIDRVEAQS